ncbi:MAG: hypothetical protein U0527_01980 [Candidatus Eisenbacteria bacterium]
MASRPTTGEGAIARAAAWREVAALGGVRVPTGYRGVETECSDLMDRAALLPAAWEGVLAIAGADWRTFLHNLLTQDIRALDAGTVRPAALADRKGHLEADLWVAATPEGDGRLRLRRDLMASVLALFDRHRFREQVEWREAGGESARFLLLGPSAPAAAAACGIAADAPAVGRHEWLEWFEVRETAAREYLLSVPVEQVAALVDRLAPHAPLVGFDAFHRVRLIRGVAWFGFEADPARLVPETGLLDRVSYTKGCYLGQEPLARAHYQGALNWMLHRFALGAAPSGLPLDLVDSAGDRLGWIASSAPRGDGAIGLGYLHRRALDPPRELSTRDGVPVQDLGEARPPEQLSA